MHGLTVDIDLTLILRLLSFPEIAAIVEISLKVFHRAISDG